MSMVRPESGEGVDHLVVTSKDVMKFKAVEFVLEPSYPLMVGRYAGVTAIRLPRDPVDDKLRVVTNVKPLDPKLSGEVQDVHEGLIFRPIVCGAKM
jgi:hypothetical protein